MFSLERLNRMETEFEAANIRLGEATWNVYSGEAAADLDGAQQEIARLFSDRDNNSVIEAGLSAVDPARDPALARRLQVWRNSFNGSAVDAVPEIYLLKNRLQERIAAFEFELDGMKVLRSNLQQILRTEPDRLLRHRAWSATAPLAQANREELRRLIELRNSKARELGYRDYVDLVFRVQEIDEPWLLQILKRLIEAARPRYAEIIGSLAQSIGVKRLAPWDIQFAMRRGLQLPDSYFPAATALEKLRKTAQGLGFDVDSLPVRTLVRDIPFGGYNVAVRIPGDSRFLVNPSEGHSFYTTTFHEYGHSLQAVFTAVDWPILKEYEWVMGAHTPAYSEGMAEVMGEFARRADWLTSVGGVPQDLARRYRSDFLPAQMLVRLFELMLHMRIELSAYEDASQDMSIRERRLMDEIRLLEFPDDEPSHWEANTWYTSYPIYWHNYILSSLVAFQVHETLTERFGENTSSRPETAGYLADNFYAPGNSVPWWQRILGGTGRQLSADAYLRVLHEHG